MAKLIFRYGAMGCGKTTHLLQVAHNYNQIKKNVQIIKPALDSKGDDKVVSRIGVEQECAFLFSKTDNLIDIFRNEEIMPDCILVDEAQFLTPEQVDQLLSLTINFGVDVICYGLRTNFRKTDSGFEGATRLLQIAHDIEEIKTLCQCGRKAIFQGRFLDDKMITDGPDVLIDDGSSKIEYRALCATCYNMYALMEHILKTSNEV